MFGRLSAVNNAESLDPDSVATFFCFSIVLHCVQLGSCVCLRV